MALFFIVIPLLFLRAWPWIRPKLITVLEQIKFRTGQKDTFTMDDTEFIIEKRTTLVRIQKPKPLLMGLRIGGRMEGLGWEDVEIAKYETHPEGALEQAVEDYDGYKIAMYREIDPDGNLSNMSTGSEELEEIQHSGWITVNPERDLPDE